MLHIFSAVIQLSNVEILSETSKVVKSYLLEQKYENLQSEQNLKLALLVEKYDIRDDKMFSK